MLSLGPRSPKGGSKHFLSVARAEEGFAVGTRVVSWSVCLPVRLSWCLTSIAVIHLHLRTQRVCLQPASCLNPKFGLGLCLSVTLE